MCIPMPCLAPCAASSPPASLPAYPPVPSACRWGSYGVWQQVLWQQLNALRGHSRHSEGDILRVQTVAGVLTGCTSAILTNPLDVVKTRLQTAGAAGAAVQHAPAAAAAAQPALAAAGAAAANAGNAGGCGATAAAAAAARPTWRGVAAQLAAQEGAAGFFRGVAPRMVSSSLWGTMMVTAYEWLKRLCIKDE